MAFKILSLPPEVRLNVLDKLPIKEIQLLRHVCKDFKAFVDLNKVKITTPVIARETNRITKYAADNVFYADNPSYIETLLCWCKHKGNWKCAECERMLHVMAIHHILQRPGIIGTLTVDESLSLVHHSMPIYQACFLDQGTTHDKDGILENLTVLSTLGCLDFDIAAAKDLCNELFRLRDGKQIKQHPEDEHFVILAQKFALTSARAMVHHSDSFRILEVPGRCSFAAISKTFGVLELPSCELFAYCVRSKKMREHLCGLLKDTDEAVALDPMFKAALMEEMFIF